MRTVFCFFHLSQAMLQPEIKLNLQKKKNVNIERDDATLKSMKPMQFLNNNCFCVCTIYIMHTAFMYAGMIWKEQAYNMKYKACQVNTKLF